MLNTNLSSVTPVLFQFHELTAGNCLVPIV